MLPTPIKTVITGLRDLMLWPPEAETVDDIKATVEPIIGGYGHKNLYYDIVRTGRRLWISVYITFDKDIISLSKFQILQTKCIAALAEKYQVDSPFATKLVIFSTLLSLPTICL